MLAWSRQLQFSPEGRDESFVLSLSLIGHDFLFSYQPRVFTTQILEAWEVWMATVQHPGPLEETNFDIGQFLSTSWTK